MSLYHHMYTYTTSIYAIQFFTIIYKHMCTYVYIHVRVSFMHICPYTSVSNIIRVKHIHMYTYVYIYIYLCSCLFQAHVHIYISLYHHMYTYSTSICAIKIPTIVCKHICTYVYIHVPVYFMHVCTYTSVSNIIRVKNIHMYTYVYIRIYLC